MSTIPPPVPDTWRARVSPEVRALRELLVEDRRHLHRHPELPWQEVETSGFIASRLESLGVDVRTGVGRTGVVGTVTGGKGAGPVVLFRADMDALPIQEQATHDYKSERDGVSHACGHDAHVAVGLGLARMLSSTRDDWGGQVKLAFQPAEEGDGGAQAMIDDGLLEDPHVDVAFAQHVDAELPVGAAAARPGTAFSGCQNFEITVTGEGAHAASPHRSTDPLLAAATLVTTLQSVVARRIDPMQPAVVTVGRIQAGSASNVIPNVATLAGTLRAHERSVLSRLAEEVARTARGVVAAHGYEAGVDFGDVLPPVVNDAGWAQRVRRVMGELLDEEAVFPGRIHGSEDMAHVLERVPGCYFRVGARNEDRGIVHPHHHELFDVDEDCLEVGLELAHRIVRDALSHAQGSHAPSS